MELREELSCVLLSLLQRGRISHLRLRAEGLLPLLEDVAQQCGSENGGTVQQLVRDLEA